MRSPAAALFSKSATKKGVIDCGMEQGKDLFENQELPVAASVLDFALVTHAHVDHSGLLPLLYKNGFRGTVYATGATCSLLDIMLRDCAHIQMADAEWKSRKAMRRGEAAVEPLYDLDDVAGLMKLLHPCEYGSQVQVNESVTIRFTDVGHLLGSAAIEIWLKEGDCEKEDRLLRRYRQPRSADTLRPEAHRQNRLPRDRVHLR